MASLNMSNVELREMSRRFRSMAGRYQSDAIELRKLIDQLSVNWKGSEFDLMTKRLAQYVDMDARTAEILLNIAENLSKTAEAYEVSEAQLVDDILNSNHLF